MTRMVGIRYCVLTCLELGILSLERLVDRTERAKSSELNIEVQLLLLLLFSIPTKDVRLLSLSRKGFRLFHLVGRFISKGELNKGH